MRFIFRSDNNSSFVSTLDVTSEQIFSNLIVEFIILFFKLKEFLVRLEK